MAENKFPKEIYLQGNLRLDQETTKRKDARFHDKIYKDPGPTQRPNNSIPLTEFIQEKIDNEEIILPESNCDCDCDCEDLTCSIENLKVNDYEIEIPEEFRKSLYIVPESSVCVTLPEIIVADNNTSIGEMYPARFGIAVEPYPSGESNTHVLYNGSTPPYTITREYLLENLNLDGIEEFCDIEITETGFCVSNPKKGSILSVFFNYMSDYPGLPIPTPKRANDPRYCNGVSFTYNNPAGPPNITNGCYYDTIFCDIPTTVEILHELEIDNEWVSITEEVRQSNIGESFKRLNFPKTITKYRITINNDVVYEENITPVNIKYIKESKTVCDYTLMENIESTFSFTIPEYDFNEGYYDGIAIYGLLSSSSEYYFNNSTFEDFEEFLNNFENEIADYITANNIDYITITRESNTFTIRTTKNSILNPLQIMLELSYQDNVNIQNFTASNTAYTAMYDDTGLAYIEFITLPDYTTAGNLTNFYKIEGFNGIEWKEINSNHANVLNQFPENYTKFRYSYITNIPESYSDNPSIVIIDEHDGLVFEFDIIDQKTNCQIFTPVTEEKPICEIITDFDDRITELENQETNLTCEKIIAIPGEKYVTIPEQSDENYAYVDISEVGINPDDAEFITDDGEDILVMISFNYFNLDGTNTFSQRSDVLPSNSTFTQIRTLVVDTLIPSALTTLPPNNITAYSTAYSMPGFIVRGEGNDIFTFTLTIASDTGSFFSKDLRLNFSRSPGGNFDGYNSSVVGSSSFYQLSFDLMTKFSLEIVKDSGTEIIPYYDVIPGTLNLDEDTTEVKRVFRTLTNPQISLSFDTLEIHEQEEETIIEEVSICETLHDHEERITELENSSSSPIEFDALNGTYLDEDGNVKLGGELIEDTVIDLNNYNFGFANVLEQDEETEIQYLYGEDSDGYLRKIDKNEFSNNPVLDPNLINYIGNLSISNHTSTGVVYVQEITPDKWKTDAVYELFIYGSFLAGSGQNVTLNFYLNDVSMLDGNEKKIQSVVLRSNNSFSANGGVGITMHKNFVKVGNDIYTNIVNPSDIGTLALNYLDGILNNASVNTVYSNRSTVSLNFTTSKYLILEMASLGANSHKVTFNAIKLKEK